MRVILASASPRRKELLERLFDDFEIIPAQGEEIVTTNDPEKVVKELSFQKAREVEDRLFKDDEDKEIYLIIGSDTVVSKDGRILGKPKDEDDAMMMLGFLSGDVHMVSTGVTIIKCVNGERKYKTFHENTMVEFYNMTGREIREYVYTGEPMDKAGAYGIQGLGARFVKRIEGSNDNVIGLPVARLYQELKEL